MAGKGWAETPVCVYQSQTPSLGGKILTFFFCQGSEMLGCACQGTEWKRQVDSEIEAKDELEVETTSTICQGH